MPKKLVCALVLFWVFAISLASSAGAARYVALGDSISLGRVATPLSQGFAFRVRDHLNATHGAWTLINRAVGGVKVAQVQSDQLPTALVADPDLVTLYIGINDVTTIPSGGESAAALQARFLTSFADIVSQLRLQTRAFIVVANVPDASLIPEFAASTQAKRDVLHFRTLAVNAAIADVAAAQRVPMVDLFGSAGSYDAANFASDGLHPNNNGHQNIALLFEEKLASLLVVTNATDNDDGVCDANCSLREAMNAANDETNHPGADTITFALPVANPPVITLNAPLPNLNSDVEIHGPATKVTVRQTSGGCRLFQVTDNHFVRLSYLQLENGSAGAAADGGALLNLGGSVSLSECVLAANQAGGRGGGIFNQAGTVSLTNCTLSGNTAEQGGALFNQDGTMSLLNCTLSGNSATGRGSAICNESSNGVDAANLSLMHCTIAANSGSEGVANALGSVTLGNTLLANGSAGNLVSASGSITSQGYNLSDDAGGGFLKDSFDQVNTDPLLDPLGLQDNGGPTPTILLQPGSPAHDAGKDIVNAGRDQRGLLRSANVLSGISSGDGSDIGAVEMEASELPTLNIGFVRVYEGQAGLKGTVEAAFAVTLTAPASRDVSVDWGTEAISATPNSDYVSAAGTLTIPAGQRGATLFVTVKADLLPEATETFFVNLSNPVNAALHANNEDNRAVCSIDDDDQPPYLRINNQIIVEGNSGLVNASFTVTLSEPSAKTVTVACATTKPLLNVATSNADYVALPLRTLTFAPGEVSQIVTVQILGDTIDEINESFLVKLSNPKNATVDVAQGIGTIVDDDDPPALRINDVTVLEGPPTGTIGGTTPANFTVTLSAPSGKTVTVQYATAVPSGFPATADVDYKSVSLSTLTFAPGQISKTVTVLVKCDVLDEADERFAINLSTPLNATLADNQGFCTIIDDDAPPSLSINDPNVYEGNIGTLPITFTVRLSAPSGKVVTVKYASAMASSNSATANVDYISLPPAMLTFAPGETVKTVTGQVIGDTLDEVDERFAVNLSAAANAAVADNQGFGTILDNDPAPGLAVNNVAVIEGNPVAGTPGTVSAIFTVSLSAISSKTVTVQYATGTPGSCPATADIDYISVPVTTLSFLPGETRKTVTVQVKSDVLDEDVERFSLNLKNAVNASVVDPEGFGTINDDDAAPSLSINDIALAEGNLTLGAPVVTAFTFTVSLSAPSGKVVTVKAQTNSASALIATPGIDYTALPLTTLTFLPGQTAAAVVVFVTGDTAVEGTERFIVKLSSAVNASISDSEGMGTILDDDLVALLDDSAARLFDDSEPSS